MGDFDDDLDHLASELNLVAPLRRHGGAAPFDRIRLRRLRELQGSDLLLVTGAPGHARISPPASDLRTRIGTDDIEAALMPLVSPRLQDDYHRGAAVDLAFTVRGLGRFG